MSSVLDFVYDVVLDPVVDHELLNPHSEKYKSLGGICASLLGHSRGLQESFHLANLRLVHLLLVKLDKPVEELLGVAEQFVSEG